MTSSVAISVVFLFLFANSGRGQRAARRWSASTARSGSPTRAALIHLLLGGLGLATWTPRPAALADHGRSGLSWWEWLSGPSVAMCTIIMLVVWTTSGTFMLMFLAALQDIPVALEEASHDRRRQPLAAVPGRHPAARCGRRCSWC